MAIDTANKYLVALSLDNNRVQLLRPYLRDLTREDALTLAAWLVCVGEAAESSAGFPEPTWEEILAAVRET